MTNTVVQPERWNAPINDAAAAEPLLKGGGGDGTFDDMEKRIAKLEQSVISIRESQERVERHIEALSSSFSTVLTSQTRIEERMERVMDRARDMPTPTAVDTMITTKLGLSALIIACLGILIAAITYVSTL